MTNYRVQATRIRRVNKAEYIKNIKAKKIRHRIADMLKTALVFIAFFIVPYGLPAILESII